jgi:hypothetical protein
MAQKAPKIDDVKKPGRAAPEASSRPLIVTNRPVITNDPMMVAPAAGAPELKPAEQPLARTAKVIKPLDASLTAPVTVPGLSASVAAVSQAVPEDGATPDATTDTATSATTGSAVDTAPDASLNMGAVPATEAVPATVNQDAKLDETASALPPVAIAIPVDTAAVTSDDTTVTVTAPDATVPDVVAADVESDLSTPKTAPAVPASLGSTQSTTPESSDLPAESVDTAPGVDTSNADAPATKLVPPPSPAVRASVMSDSKPASGNSLPSVSETEDLQRDSQAAATAEEAAVLEAKAAREQQLEQMVTDGTYFVPINAVQRKRSRIYILLLCLLALVLAAALVDAALDMGLVTLPVDIPHTSYFSH